MFWTAFVWGTGVSCGAAIGLIALVVMFWGLQWLVGKTEKQRDYAERTLQALLSRNEMTEETNKYLEAVANYAAIMAEKKT